MKKEITLLLNTFPALSETFILNQVTGLIRAGWTVRVISLRKPDFSQVHPDFETFRCGDNLRVIGIPDSLGKRALRGSLILLKLLFLCPRKVFAALSRKGYTTAAFSLKNLFLLNALRKSRIPLMQAHFGPNGLVGVFLKDMGILDRLIVTFHGSDINSYPRKYGERVYTPLYQKADLLTANTSFTAGKLEANGATKNSIEVIPVGLHCKDYPLRQDPDNPAGFQLVTVGRLVEKKGHRYMVEALAELKKDFPHLQWHIVGSGPLEQDLKDRIEKAGLKDQVIFHGSLPADKVRERLAAAHLFILPSATSSSGDMEGQGLVLQEAQAMGVPVVSTLHNGIPDGVLDGETGLLVPEKDPQSLAQAVAALLKDAALRESMGKRGALFVREKYDIPLLTQEWIRCYSKLSVEKSR